MLAWQNNNSVTYTTSAPSNFRAGDRVVVSGTLSKEFGTNWPRILSWLPDRVLFFIQFLVEKITKHKFGPQKFTVVSVESNSFQGGRG